ncbi:MAG TPA: hypothetical protein VKO87_00325 [Gemmatimonadaceae bacterium]|nr:hypothetical protein [Gemmatimonadaceae bacterium]
MKSIRWCLIALALVVSAGTASAQTVAGSLSGVQRLNLVSANPIGLLFEWYNGEFEHAISSTASVAFAASRFSFDDPEHYTVADAIVRYYPAARAIRGFSVGASIGLVNHHDNSSCFDVCTNYNGTTAAIGVRGDYVWIIGRDQHFSVATGIGAKRVIGNDIGTEGLPIGRLSIGYAW